jgi:muramoyltetrapeptide carboxypeptidase
LLDCIDWRELSSVAPKVLVGSSDVTALHQVVGDRLGVVSLFGPMVGTVALAGDSDGAGADGTDERTDERTAQHLRETLAGETESVVLRATNPVEVVPGTAEGVTTGGTLTLLAALAGTPYAGSADGAIVFVEDVGESPYRLDRLLTQLRQAGWFSGVRGVVLGSWTACGDGAAEVLAERLDDLGVPVLAGLPAGHGHTQLTVPLGVRATLDTGAATLVLDQPALG